MKCPNCGANISELNEICPKCKINLDEYEENVREQYETNNEHRKSNFIKTIQIIIIILTIVASLIGLIMEEIVLVLIMITSAIIIYFTLNIFKVIIDLLQSIDEKLEKNEHS